MEAEFGVPMWTFGAASYADLGGGRLLVAFNDPSSAGSGLGVVDTAARTLTRIDTGFSGFGRLCVNVSGDTGAITIATVAGSASKAAAVVSLSAPSADALLASTPADWTTLRPSSDLTLDPGYVSAPRSVAFSTTGGKTAYMNLYLPANKDYVLPAGDKPALLVKIHGGPTSQASALFNAQYQVRFWSFCVCGVLFVCVCVCVCVSCSRIQHPHARAHKNNSKQPSGGRAAALRSPTSTTAAALVMGASTATASGGRGASSTSTTCARRRGELFRFFF